MKTYDIMHVEDELMTRKLVEFSSIARGLKYKSAETLAGLKEALETSQARFYVVDGDFPRGGPGSGRHAEMLAPEAVAYIKDRCDSPIIIYSGHDSLEDMGMEGYGVFFVRKNGDVKKLFDAIDEIS